MKRVLRLAGGGLGACLVLVVGFMWVYRHQSPAQPLMLVGGTPQPDYHEQLYLVGLDSNFRRPITDAFDGITYIAGPDHENRLYFYGYIGQDGGIYRIKLGQSQVQLITKITPRTGLWSYNTLYKADQATVYFGLTDPSTGNNQVYRVGQAGGVPIALTLLNQDVRVVAVVNDRLILDGNTPVGDHPHIYAVDMSNRAFYDLTPTASSATFERWLDHDGGWLVLQMDGRLWKMRADGSAATPLGPVGVDDVVEWIPQSQILIVSLSDKNDHLAGISLTDGALLWELPEQYWGGVSPDGTWIAFYTVADAQSLTLGPTRLERMRPDGTQRETVLDSDRHIADVWGWSPDGHSLYYNLLRGDLQWELWRWSGGEHPSHQRLYAEGSGFLYAWSPDGNYAILGSEWLRLDGAKRGFIMPDDAAATFIGWVKLPAHHWSPAGLLILGSVVLIGGIYRRGGKGQL